MIRDFIRKGGGMMRHKSMLILLLLLSFTLGYGVLATTARQNAHHGPIVSPPLEKAQKLYVSHSAGEDLEKPLLLRHYSEAAPAPVHPILRWTRVDGAVMYDVQVLRQLEADEKTGDIAYEPVMPEQRAYTNGIELALPDDFQDDCFYYRVYGLDMEGHRVSDYSAIEKVPLDRMSPFVEKPELLSSYNTGKGTVLLYPVYDWLPVPGASQYEVEILDAAPENPGGVEASQHRIDVYRTEAAQKYDPRPRYGNHPFYWRVRALDEKGGPVGVWSDAQPFLTDPDTPYEAAALGDSISHGGGSVSYSPTDWDFSYLSYLDFSVVNLAQSGDTSTMTKDRFEADVLPFRPKYLLILMGSNSLRNGLGADVVISDMEEVRKKSLEHGIRPVFLTVPPVNPDNIKQTFDDETASDWQWQIGRVNRYVRSRVHIDITPGMYDNEGRQRTELALDGLHLDPSGKKLMAQAINAAWPDIEALPDSAWDE